MFSFFRDSLLIKTPTLLFISYDSWFFAIYLDIFSISFAALSRSRLIIND